jgi:kynurenine 3-monooxygenase
MAKPVIILGAGLCGSLLALRLAQRGLQVEVYEKRSDLRKVHTEGGRSINLAFSDRGNKGMKLVGLEKKVQSICIPMKGRMLHQKNGVKQLVPYSGRPHEYINSISREGLTALILDEAEAMPNVTLHFNHPCTSVDIDHKVAHFFNEIEHKSIEVEGEVIFGTDGAGSSLRKSCESHPLFNIHVSQEFLSHGYKELEIPPAANGGFRTENNALHIWPRGEYMCIALPNLDGSFTVTLFLNNTEGVFNFSNLKDANAVSHFFKSEFKDLFDLMPDLIQDFFRNPTSNLGTIKCDQWHYKGHTLLMGDAAHAIVPFYGQGMNASFEDVVVLDEAIEVYGNDWQKVFETYQANRKKDTDAIADLAIDNFHEMKDHVANHVFREKRRIEILLEQQFPNSYFSKYALVTFNEHIGYREAMLRGRAQDQFLLDQIKENNPIVSGDLETLLSEINRHGIEAINN